MDLEALRHGNFATLGTAINDWSMMVKQLKALETRARDDMRAKAQRANWAGVNATVSREFITKTVGEFSDAVAQATSILNILRDTRDELVKHRDDLNQAIDRAWKKKLTVVGVAGGGFKVYVNVHPEPPDSEQAMKGVVDELQGILDRATTSDSTAARALTALANQADHGFSSAKYADRDSAADALEKAADMAALAKDAKKLTPEQLAELNRTLAQHKNDELFAAEFATKLGARNTLQFWADMSSLHLGARDSELHQLQDFQENLSTTLATATLSDADGMTAWKRQVIEEGTKVYTSDNPAHPTRGPMSAMGFQVMSSLMGQGKYDAEFLDAYGKKLLKADMAPTGGAGMNTNDLWKAPNQLTDLVFGEEDGQDPMVGFMKALSHNPEAATNTFADKEVFKHSLESIRYTDRDAAVAGALEAAVLGTAVGEVPSEPVPRSTTQAEIMRMVTETIAQPDGASLVTKETGEHFGRMASGYMPEINRALYGEARNSVFLTDSADPDPFSQTDVGRFLYEVAQDPDGARQIRFGESIYTASSLEAHIANPSLYDGETKEAITYIAKNAGLIEGIVAHSEADAQIGSELGSEKEENDARKRTGDFMKAIIGVGIGAGAAALVPQTVAGAVIGATASGYFGGISGMAVDRLIDGRQADGALDRALYATGKGLDAHLESATLQTQDSAMDALKLHRSDLPPDATQHWINDAVRQGWTNSDSFLEDRHKRPSA
ncbi:hypothetical protein [Streptomyces roseolilacinus]|uniref:Uncharacterized protein n=1 Tax=Streptomyces roseolilacinus TaxID=66904 RepID=A0A918B6C8_9ACTN|nr:hypothetical protein [Streptomyces roseolilacinus]GGQ25925.1 hypothetical protein GCM10010249_51050 [Streptomyces roseolilacinus]